MFTVASCVHLEIVTASWFRYLNEHLAFRAQACFVDHRFGENISDTALLANSASTEERQLLGDCCVSGVCVSNIYWAHYGGSTTLSDVPKKRKWSGHSLETVRGHLMICESSIDVDCTPAASLCQWPARRLEKMGL